eukprot:325028-Rhodomonas_salina.1
MHTSTQVGSLDYRGFSRVSHVRALLNARSHSTRGGPAADSTHATPRANSRSPASSFLQRAPS